MNELPVQKQKKVLDFARSLAKPIVQGSPGRLLLQFAGAIDESDLDIMTPVIEEDCERIDADGW